MMSGLIQRSAYDRNVKEPDFAKLADVLNLRIKVNKLIENTKRVANITIYVTACCFVTFAIISCVIPDRSDIRRDTTKPFLITRNDNFEWTWICQDNICKRLAYSNSTILQSSESCNMLCGSTQLWPQPTGPIHLAGTAVPLAINKVSLKIDQSPSKGVTELLNNAFTLFKQDLLKIELELENQDLKLKIINGVIHELVVHVFVDDDEDPRLRLDTDESYKLILKTENNTLLVNVTAHSFYGARNSFETVLQLIWVDPYAKSLLVLESASIEDSPKFKYRGLLIDTIRSFFTLEDILSTVDAMGAIKLNTFHWRATDSHAFPLSLNSASQLEHRTSGLSLSYSIDDILKIVYRARLRGIRVILEIDALAHVSKFFSNAFDSYRCIELNPWHQYCSDQICPQLDLEDTSAFDYIENLYVEIMNLTDVYDILHIGAEPDNGRCWYEHVNFVQPTKLWFEFMQKLYEAIERANKGHAPELTIMWSSELTDDPYLHQLNSSQFTVQLGTETDSKAEQKILDAGFRYILSFVNTDCKSDSLGSCELYHNWQLAYEHRPWKTWFAKRRIEGATTWQKSERLDSVSLDSQDWVRSIAVAERLWSDPDHYATPDVHLRLNTQKLRLEIRNKYVPDKIN